MKYHIGIEGMSCMHCAGKVEKALHALSEGAKVKVNLKKKTALFQTKQEVASDAVREAITQAGYSVTMLK